MGNRQATPPMVQHNSNRGSATDSFDHHHSSHDYSSQNHHGHDNEGHFVSTRDRQLDVLNEVEQRTKDQMRERRMSPDDVRRAEHWFQSQREYTKSAIPETNRQDEQIIQKAASKATVNGMIAAGAGVGLAALLGIKSGGKKPVDGKISSTAKVAGKRAIWPFVVLPAIGFIATEMVQARKAAKEIADSSSNSDYARQIRQSIKPKDVSIPVDK